MITRWDLLVSWLVPWLVGLSFRQSVVRISQMSVGWRNSAMRNLLSLEDGSRS